MARRGIADKLVSYQANAWPAMVQTLADSLGVSSESLTKLGIGYVPIVTFKNGDNYNGWWCVPERDAAGKLVGLALRSRDGSKKLMYPGSNHGLVFPWAGGTGSSYRSGPDNWVRLYDAKVDCPICGKPDGCLVSSDDPHDPKAAICIRMESPRKTGFGWLHVRKPEGDVKGGKLLPESPHPIVVVEGMSDCAAVLDLGFVGVGRPSALGGMGQLAKLCRGRAVIVCGENDEAGKKGLDSCRETLRLVCSDVRCILPPETYKDLRAWFVAEKLTQEAFLDYVTRTALQDDPGASLLEDTAPLYLAERWLGDVHSRSDTLLLRRYKGQWFRFDNSRYSEVDPDAVIRGGLYSYLNGRQYKKLASDGSVSVDILVPRRALVSDIVDALNKSCPVPVDPPSWLDGREEPNPKRLVGFTNGYLDLDGFVGGDCQLLESTPNLFSLVSLPYDFDPDAVCPQWLEWTTQTLGDDPAKIALLQEWFGLNMIPDMSYEKFMLFVGGSRSGKGTALEVLRGVVGPKQVATTSFGSLANDFGRAPLVGKLAAFMSDARLPKKVDSMRALETLLSVIGGDGVNINRKNLPELPDHKLSCRFTIAVNEIPSLPDHSQALEARLLVLHFSQSFKGREDRTLKVRLPREAPGIALWALEGLKRLVTRGLFTEPVSSGHVREEFRRVTSPIVEFVEECCTVGADQEVGQPELYDAYLGWAKERSLPAGSRSYFRGRIVSAFPMTATQIRVESGRKKHVFTGLELEDWATKTFLGRPR